MFPWFWVWAPRFEYPLSGNVSQDIMTRWFSQIPERAGDATTERAIFEDTSYGRQLGLLIEVLAARLENSPIDPAKAVEAERQLKDLYRRIEAIKASHAEAGKSGNKPLVEQLKGASEAELAAVRDYVNSLPTPKSPT